ncbi:MAG: SHOCT domain-containing protein [Oscillospiraceae bacterium]|nr:SHOCT domain-containing protein [Oscillospiraceae bacterium]
MWFLYFLLAIIGLWIFYLLAVEFQKAAKAKGWLGEKYKWICFFLPLAGYLLVIALPDRKSDVQSQNNATALKELDQLHNSGALTDDEYKKMRADILKTL